MTLLKMLLEFLTATCQSIISHWNQFWFSPADPLPLGVLRLLAGGMLFYTHLVWGIDLHAFFGPDGWHSLEAIQQFQQDQNAHSIWWLVPVEWMRIAHTVMAAVLFLFFIGVATPVTSVLALIITISNSNRAPIANYGLDQILCLLTLYLAIGPSGARLSIDRLWKTDRLWKRFRTNRTCPTQQKSTEALAVQKSARANLALRLIQVHFCIIYFFAGTAKLQGNAWWSGEAIWMTFANEEYQSIDMTWLAYYPRVTEIMTHVTVLWELSFAFLIWNRALRPWVLFIGALMHLGIVFALGMPTFGLIMIFGYTAFLSPEFLHHILKFFTRTKQNNKKSDPPDLSNKFEDSMLFTTAPVHEPKRSDMNETP